MTDRKKMTLGELRSLVKEAIEELAQESMMDEKFGEKIGDQHAGVGVADECMDESTPKGYEKIVKGIKKSGSAKNPWAVANAMKKKGIKPKK